MNSLESLISNEKYEEHIMQNSILWPKLSFGIFKNRLPDRLYNELLKETDDLLNQQEDTNRNANSKLAGRMYQGKQVDILDKISNSFKKYALCCVEKYIRNINNESTLKEDLHLFSNLTFSGAWVVSQYQQDYNPTHTHSGKISAVIYLKVPEQIKLGSSREKEYIKNRQVFYDGKINFIFNNIPVSRSYYHSNWLVTPEEKVMYLFPSWLMHTVYPYDGEGERRSVSFNLI